MVVETQWIKLVVKDGEAKIILYDCEKDEWIDWFASAEFYGSLAEFFIRTYGSERNSVFCLYAKK